MEDRWVQIYAQINGACQPKEWDGVLDESGPDGCIGPLVDEIFAARASLCERYGITPEDRDLDRMVDGYERLCRVCGKLMYQYGVKDGTGLAR